MRSYGLPQPYATKKINSVDMQLREMRHVQFRYIILALAAQLKVECGIEWLLGTLYGFLPHISKIGSLLSVLQSYIFKI